MTVLYISIGAAAFVAFFVGVLLILSQLAGWRALAAAYPGRERPQIRKPFVGVRVNGVSYHGCVTVGANSSGLYLAVMAILRPGHAPIFIPWAEASTSRVDSPYGPMVRLIGRALPDTPVDIPLPLAEWLGRESGEESRLS